MENLSIYLDGPSLDQIKEAINYWLMDLLLIHHYLNL